MLADFRSRACTYRRTAFICCSHYLRTPRSAPFEACGTVRPRSAPQNLSPTFDGGRSGDADLRVFQRLWINPIAARPSRPSAARRCSTASDSWRFAGTFRPRPSRPGSRLASPSLIKRDSESQKTAVLQVIKPPPGLEPGTASLPWRFEGGTGGHGRTLAITFFLQIGP
jgi:hypothetical protein